MMKRPLDTSQSHTPVPVLITWDVDPDLWIPVEKRRQALHLAMEVCRALHIPATFFFTARPADIYAEDFASMAEQGHEVGCHGLTHGIEENYDRMPPAMQREYLTEATDRLTGLLGRPVRSFRGPRVKISATTLSLLAELGYRADSSVCSQRIDVISSNLINTGWMTAPRRPYRPSAQNAFRAGNIPLWEVPVSAAVLPFISSLMRVTGLSMMKWLARTLVAESRRTGKPVVYLAHPTEFLGRAPENNGFKRWRAALNPKYFTPKHIRAHGFPVRNLLYVAGGPLLAEYTRHLFQYVAALPGVTFLTMSDYVTNYLPGSAGEQRG